MLSPAPAAACSVAAGRILAPVLAVAPPLALALAAAFALGALGLVRRPAGAIPLALLSLFCFALPGPEPLPEIQEGRRTLVGTVVALPRVSVRGTAFEFVSVVNGARWQAFAPAGGVALAPGDRVRVAGRFARAERARNPGGFDYRRFLERRGVVGVVQGARVERIVSPTGPGQALAGLSGRIVATVRQRLPAPDAALLEGLLLSSRRDIDPDLADAFLRTGTIHALSTSGLHISALVFGARFVLERLTAPVALRLALPLLSAWGLVLLVDLAIPTVRAAGMATLVLLAPTLRRRADPLHALCVTALLEMLWRPESVCEIGAQLSYGTVGALLYLAPVWERWFDGEREATRRGRAAAWLWQGVAVSVTAHLVSAPLVAYHFFVISTIAPLANLAAIPLTELALLGGALALLLDGLPGVGVALWWGESLALRVVSEVVLAFARVPGGCLSIAPPPADLVVGSYILLAGSAVGLRWRCCR